MVKLSLQQLTAEADTIVRGTVTGQASAWNAQRSAIYTDVTVAVEEVIKGSPGATVTFRIAGGAVGDIGMRTSNDPVFRDGEQVIVFLATTGTTANVVGLHQGKYTVKNGTVTRDGRTLAVTDFIKAIRVGMTK
ncbi:MAG: hypothetical protein HY725_05435 [Candidatus Rokubacteria bacterium]|nr:hypothetical protein [Candidatus Rokubacteria bacterium]